jgi:hypothetical protein
MKQNTVIAVIVAVVAAIVAYWWYTSTKAKVATPANIVPKATTTFVTSTTTGTASGVNYGNTPGAWSTNLDDVLNLAAQTQNMISSGVGGILAPVIAVPNAIAGWIGGW